MLIAILDLLILTAIVAAVVAGIWLMPVALRWDFGRHPALTTLFLIGLFFMLVIAALAAPRPFPGCTFPATGMVRAICR